MLRTLCGLALTLLALAGCAPPLAVSGAAGRSHAVPAAYQGDYRALARALAVPDPRP